MSLIEVKVEHGQTLDEARDRLSRAVGEIEGKFGSMVRRVEWSTDRESVRLEGPGVRLDLRVDDQVVHVSGDIPMLAGLLGSSRLKQIVESSFKKPSALSAGAIRWMIVSRRPKPNGERA